MAEMECHHQNDDRREAHQRQTRNGQTRDGKHVAVRARWTVLLARYERCFDNAGVQQAVPQGDCSTDQSEWQRITSDASIVRDAGDVEDPSQGKHGDALVPAQHARGCPSTSPMKSAPSVAARETSQAA